MRRGNRNDGITAPCNDILLCVAAEDHRFLVTEAMDCGEEERL